MEHEQQRKNYIREHCSAEDPLLAELNRQTNLRILNPKMLSGPLQGKLLEMLSFMIRPASILEIGTFTGYSAICLAKGLAGGGMLHTIDKNDEIRDFALDYIHRAGFANSIILHSGDALEIIPMLAGPFDLVFIDGEKSEYKKYYELVFPKVRPGGFIIADNVLWNEKVYKPEYRNDEYTGYILAFNKMVREDRRVDNILLPLRDGLMIMRKIS